MSFGVSRAEKVGDGELVEEANKVQLQELGWTWKNRAAGCFSAVLNRFRRL